jgi:mRNA interferase MazF
VTFKRFTVVRVSFPFTEQTATKNRPALILSDTALFNGPAGHSIMAMITSAGLPSPSTIRFKLFTLDHRLVRGELGQLAPVDEQNVHHALTQLFGIQP